jgi:hypothetical protein
MLCWIKVSFMHSNLPFQVIVEWDFGLCLLEFHKTLSCKITYANRCRLAHQWSFLLACSVSVFLRGLSVSPMYSTSQSWHFRLYTAPHLSYRSYLSLGTTSLECRLGSGCYPQFSPYGTYRIKTICAQPCWSSKYTRLTRTAGVHYQTKIHSTIPAKVSACISALWTVVL